MNKENGLSFRYMGSKSPIHSLFLASKIKDRPLLKELGHVGYFAFSASSPCGRSLHYIYIYIYIQSTSFPIVVVSWGIGPRCRHMGIARGFGIVLAEGFEGRRVGEGPVPALPASFFSWAIEKNKPIEEHVGETVAFLRTGEKHVGCSEESKIIKMK